MKTKIIVNKNNSKQEKSASVENTEEQSVK